MKIIKTGMPSFPPFQMGRQAGINIPVSFFRAKITSMMLVAQRGKLLQI
jgi:hypothetical protein